MLRFTASRRATTAGLLLAAYLPAATGCTSWQAQTGSAEAVFAAHPQSTTQAAAAPMPGSVASPDSPTSSFESVRVSTRTRSQRELFAPRIANDTLYGRPASDAPEVAIPVAQITSLEVMKFSAGKTVGLVLGIAASVTLIAGTAALINGLDDPYGDTISYGGETYTSCPLIYSWDGTDWHLDSGTYGGAIMPALQRTDVDNLLYATAQGGTVLLRLADEQQETEYVDALDLVAVDHPANVTVAPDASGNGVLHTLRAPVAPLAARSTDGDDVRAAILSADELFWASALRTRDASDPAAWRDGIELTFARPAGASEAKLIVDGRNTEWSAWLVGAMVRGWGRDVLGWYDPSTTTQYAKLLAPALMDDAFLTVSLWRAGAWQRAGFVWEAGPEVAKRQVVRLDLAGVTGDSVRVRLESAPTLWMLDQVAIDYSSDEPVVTHSATMTSAAWPDGSDAGAALRSIDRSYLTLETGDHVDLSFTVPAVAPGMTRSYIARTTGWYRVHGAETAEPNAEMLAQLRQPHGAASIVIRYANHALTAWR